MNACAIRRLAAGDTGLIHATMATHPRLPDHKAIGVLSQWAKPPAPTASRVQLARLPRTGNDSNWVAYRAAVGRLRDADKRDGVEVTGDRIWARMQVAAAETFGIRASRPSRRHPRRRRYEPKSSAAWSLDFRYANHCWKECKRRLQGPGAAGPCVVRAADGSLLLGDAAREATLQYCSALYEHPSERLDEGEYELMWEDMRRDVSETLKDVPKVDKESCSLPRFEDFERVRSRLKRHSGASGDGRLNDLFVEAPPEEARDLFDVYYSKVACGEVDVGPEQRVSNLRRLYKKGDAADRGNYRGISEQSHCYKVTEWTVMEVCRRALDAIMPPELCGFRQNRGCQLATIRLRAEIDLARCSQRDRFFITFDVSAAFDTQLRELDAEIYRQLGCDEQWVAVNQRLWADMRGRLTLDGHEVGLVHCHRGVLQGSRNSPDHYKVFTFFLYHKFKKTCPLVSQQWVADDALFSLDLTDKLPDEANREITHLVNTVVQVYDSVLMHTAAHKTQAYMLSSR
eukprot:gene9002-21341_t